MQLPFDQKYLKYGYKIWYVILGICYMILSILSYLQLEISLDKYELIIQNWKQSPITEMSITYGECGYLEEQLFNYNWPGTNEGCDCRNIKRLLMPLRHLQEYKQYPNKIIYPHKCENSQIFYGCQPIQPIKKKQFNFFPVFGGDYGYQICVKRERSNSFYENPPQQDGCPEGYLQCGLNKDYIHCTQEFQCPITQFYVNKTSSMTGNEKIQMKNGYALFISREFSDGMAPIIETRISEGDGVCMMNNESSISKGREDYLLMSKKRTECEIDQRFQVYYKVNEIQYYKVNNELDLSTTLPEYEISQMYQWGIYTRKQILWKMECRGDMLQNFKDQEIALNLINDVQIASIVISIIFFIVLSVLYNLLYFINELSQSNQQSKSFLTFTIKLGLKICILIIQLIITVMLFVLLAEEVTFFGKVIDKECSDPLTIDYIKEINNIIDNQVYKLDLAYLILFFFTTIIDIIVMGYSIREKLKIAKEKKKKEEQYTIKPNQVDEINRMPRGISIQGQAQETDNLNDKETVVKGPSLV